MYILFKKL